jgi:hypothetical protein
MKRTIFFSWQSDAPRNVGRGIIERALERAVGTIGVHSEVEEAIRDSLEVDRDTRGVSGSPPIVDTIFKKIDSASWVKPTTRRYTTIANHPGDVPEGTLQPSFARTGSAPTAQG